MDLKVQEAVGAEGHDVFSSVHSWTNAAHISKSSWSEGGGLEGEVEEVDINLMGKLLQIVHMKKTSHSGTMSFFFFTLR